MNFGIIQVTIKKHWRFDMFLDERLEKILEILKNEKKVKVTDLAEKFNGSAHWKKES